MSLLKLACSAPQHRLGLGRTNNYVRLGLAWVQDPQRERHTMVPSQKLGSRARLGCGLPTIFRPTFRTPPLSLPHLKVNSHAAAILQPNVLFAQHRDMSSGRGGASGKWTELFRKAGVMTGGMYMLSKVAGVLKFAKFGTLASMGLSVWAYSLFYGWPFAAGMVSLIFVHEMGHAIAMRQLGIKVGMYFIPRITFRCRNPLHPHL